jgi:hypothetical protein
LVLCVAQAIRTAESEANLLDSTPIDNFILAKLESQESSHRRKPIAILDSPA